MKPFFFLLFTFSLAISAFLQEVANKVAFSYKLTDRLSIQPKYTNILINPKVRTTV